jgi:hypothetical protein
MSNSRFGIFKGLLSVEYNLKNNEEVIDSIPKLSIHNSFLDSYRFHVCLFIPNLCF